MFYIQAGNPSAYRIEPREFSCLGAATNVIYPLETDNVFLVWAGIPIAIYYQDMGDVLECALPMLSKLLEEPRGEYTVRWFPSTFHGRWSLSWKDNRLEVHASWEVVSGSYERLLNERARIVMATSVFLWEWKAPLQRVKEGIEYSRAQPPPEDTELLNAVWSKIPRFGSRHEPIPSELRLMEGVPTASTS